MLKINDRIKKIFSVALSGALLSFNLFPFVISPVYATGASLELTNTVDKNLADRGEVLTYTITVKNTGNVDTTNTYLWINQPNLADYIAGSGTYTRTSTNVTNNLPDSWVGDGANFGKVPAGTNVIVKYQTRIAQNANTDNIVWSVASAKSDQTGTVQTNSWTRIILKNPALCGSKKADKTTATIGDTITFTADACNDGNVVLNDVLIYDRLDSRFDYIPGSTTLTLAGQTIAVDDGWLKLHVNVGNLNPGQHAVLTYKVKVNDTAKAGDTIQNVAQFNSTETNKWLQCAVLINVEGKGGSELPNTGPGAAFLLILGSVPAGYAFRFLKRKI